MKGSAVSVGKGGLPRDQVPGAFDHDAKSYDRLVGANPGYHEHLAKSAERLRIPGQGKGLRLLDIGLIVAEDVAIVAEAVVCTIVVALLHALCEQLANIAGHA